MRRYLTTCCCRSSPSSTLRTGFGVSLKDDRHIAEMIRNRSRAARPSLIALAAPTVRMCRMRTVGAVCRRWRRLACLTGSRSVWRAVSFSHVRPCNDVQHLRWLSTRAAHLESLEVGGEVRVRRHACAPRHCQNFWQCDGRCRLPEMRARMHSLHMTFSTRHTLHVLTKWCALCGCWSCTEMQRCLLTLVAQSCL